MDICFEIDCGSMLRNLPEGFPAKQVRSARVRQAQYQL